MHQRALQRVELDEVIRLLLLYRRRVTNRKFLLGVYRRGDATADVTAFLIWAVAARPSVI